MSKHTPGSWKTRNLTKSIEVFWPATGRKVARIPVPQFVDGEQSIANARLIAAAPELLECLHYAAEQLELWMPFEHQASVSPHSAALAKCRAAIAKATGGTP